MPAAPFRRWHEAGFTSELLPIIPPGVELTANSTVRPQDRGKAPGEKHPKIGKWHGLEGKWSEELNATPGDLKKWDAWGASVGLQSRKFLGLDIDVEDAAVVQLIGELASDYLGFGPVRYRDGSPRRLVMFALPEGAEPIRKHRIKWTDAAGRAHVVELLGLGQQFVVEGPHPKGGEYLWSEQPKPADLTSVELRHVESFFDALRAFVERSGWQIVAGTRSVTGSTTRKSLADSSLWAPGPALVLDALKAWQNTPENVPTHDDFVAALAAIKGALGVSAGDHFPDVLDWALAYDGNDEDYVTKTWNSISDTTLGWEWLDGKARAFGFTGSADADFDDAAPDASPDTPTERMLRTTIYIEDQSRYFDTEDRFFRNTENFRKKHTSVVEYGTTGTKAAEARFHNLAPKENTVQTITNRPNEPLRTTGTTDTGKVVAALNLYQPSLVKPKEGVTDANVAPYIEHATLLFGPPDKPAPKHIMDWCAFIVQRPGEKIGHCPIIVGGQGCGKDTFLEPLFKIVGEQNVATINRRDLESEWTDYNEKQIVYPQELGTKKRSTYDLLKPLISGQTTLLRINKKFMQPYYVRNTSCWIMTTNHDDALPLEPDDRRFWVHRCEVEERPGAEYFKRLHGWYDNGGVGAVYGWLLQRDISTFNPMAEPPMTAAKKAMLDASLPAGARWVRDQFAEGGTFAGRTVVTVGELTMAAREDFAAPSDLNNRQVSDALKAAGFAKGPRVRVESSSEPQSLWLCDPSGLLSQLALDRLRERHAVESKGSRGAAA
jgi:hypothetical protein